MSKTEALLRILEMAESRRSDDEVGLAAAMSDIGEIAREALGAGQTISEVKAPEGLFR